jgi:uncharacterized protein involved in exopolysaccharide biosynthesis
VEQNFSIRDIINLLFKHKLKIVFVFLLAAAVSYGVSQTIPRRYVAKAVIMVNQGREFIPISEVGDTKLEGPSQETIIGAEMQLITGRELTGKVVDSIGPLNLYPLLLKDRPGPALRDMALTEFGKDLQVQNSAARSNLIEIDLQNENAQIAAKALSALLEGLKDRHLEVFSKVRSGFLEEQLKAYEQKLQGSQRALARFRQEHQLANEEQGSLLVNQRTDLDTAFTKDTGKLAELREQLAFVKTRPGIYFTASSELRSQLNQLRRKEQELSQKYNNEAQPLVVLRDDIGLVEKQLKEQEDYLRNVECFKIESEIRPLQLRIDGLKQQMDHIDRQTLTYGKDSVELQDLKREVASNEANYEIYLKKVEEARIQDNMDERRMTNIAVVQQPSVPALPDGRKRQKALNMGLLFSLALGLGVAFVFEYAPQTLSTPESVERKLNVPLLATLEHRKNREV